MQQKYLNIREASRYLGFSVNTLYGWTSQRKIPHLKRGGRLRFDITALDRWMLDGSRDVVLEEERG